MLYCAQASVSFLDPELVHIVVVGLLGDKSLDPPSLRPVQVFVVAFHGNITMQLL